MKFFSSFILSLCSVLGFSQTILYQTENTSRTVQDPQVVVLAQGFHATSATSNPFVAKIGPGTENPGGGPIDSGAGATNPSGTTETADNKFHDTKGDIDVSGSGQLQFSLPVALPPGVKSVAPQVNLVYTSGSGNGIAGYGWNISGVTAIARMGRSIEKDGNSKGIQLDYSDYYSFNGQRLIIKSGEYGKDGAEYTTEKYSNIKIKSIGSISGKPWKGPEYWEITFEDGSQAWYGSTTSGESTARTPIEYNIVKWKDIKGNYITYNYIHSNNVSVISSILWGGNEPLNKAHFNEIDFTYGVRELTETFYVNGQLFIQGKLLSNITVNTNNSLFKKYNINYAIDSSISKYQFVESISEQADGDQFANPVKFYKPSIPQIANKEGLDTNLISQDQKLGDFDGDGRVDLLYYSTGSAGYYDCIETDDNGNCITQGAYIEPMSSGTYIVFNKLDGGLSPVKVSDENLSDGIVVGGILDSNQKLSTNQGIVTYKESNDPLPSKKLILKAYILKNNLLTLVKQKEILSSLYDQTGVYPPNPGLFEGHEDVSTYLGSFKEADINGDKISELVFSADNKRCTTTYIYNGSHNQIPTVETTCDEYYRNYVIDLFSDAPSSNQLTELGIGKSIDKIDLIDIDADGTTDFIDRGNGYFYILAKGGNLMGSAVLVDFNGEKEGLVYGDFNGDGKVDFAVPEKDVDETRNWRFYTNMGNDTFKEQYMPDFATYRKVPYSSNSGLKRQIINYNIVKDVNGDGKDDFISVQSETFRKHNLGANRDSMFDLKIKINEGGDSTGNLVFREGYTDNILSSNDAHFTPINISARIYNVDRFIMIKHGNTSLFTYDYFNLPQKYTVSSISQGGITTDISYNDLDSGNSNTSNFYQSNNDTLVYPYANLKNLPSKTVVTQLLQEGRKQDFRYRDLTAHFQGRGILGFTQSARSSWYKDGFENTKIWAGAQIDPIHDALPMKEWSIRTTDESKIFPNDISENNTQLLSFKSSVYKIDKLLNGQIVTTVQDSDKPKIVTAITPVSALVKDFLTNTVTNNTITYGDYYLPAQTVSNVNNGYAIKTSTLEYIHNLSGIGVDYYVGRPKSKTDAVQAYGDTKSAKEEYIYENNLLKTLKTWNRDNTGYTQETYNYDGFGNVTQKVISNSVDSQTQTTIAQYESKGRFVEKKIDNLGLETNITYNDLGQILTQTDPLGNSIRNTYDKWGKLLTAKSNLGGTTTYQYEKDNNSNVIMSQYDPDGNISKKFTNKLGQDYKTSTKAFGQGQYISKETQYDVLGRKIKESEPYFEGQTASQWNVTEYDDTVFPAKVRMVLFNTKETTASVSGNTTTIKEANGYGRTTSKTTDALGNTISTTDKGGTINFSYNAAGEQIQAKYAENIVTTRYDAWGRKSEFNDPSNGTYKYEYDGFGQPKKTISPKGTKEYTYNSLGQVISQKEISTTDGGEATNKMISYTYDNKGRIITKSGTSKGKVYSSNVFYDPQGRMLSASESSNDKYFIQKGLTYDDKGRVISYEKNLYSSGVLTKVTIENIYSSWNGDLYQVKDKNSGKVLWELNELNAKGQVLKTKLGAAVINNTYDSNGFLITTNHSSHAKPSILQLSYSFDAIKNELKSRTTGGDFNIVESFDYDDNNRLVNWTNPVTGIKPSVNRNIYDIKGRIIENDQVGTIKYENAAKIYQPTGMTLNAAGTQNYNNDLIQSIAYNENNDPVFINGEKGDVAFQYGLTSMRQKVSYGGNFDPDQEGKFTKFYSEDGSFEIVKDNTTGKEKHIIYIGGSPYESNIMYLKNYDDTNGSYKFLHKDYLGSILAISDEAGNKLEQRHFDAWGNFTHLQIENGPVITDKNIIDTTPLLTERGYTSHEHFAEVGIIHMNGRLYDPLLRRFLNADENIQDPTNTQNYNKYGYVMNNPLMYNDPTGEFFGLGEFLSAVIIAAIVGGTAYSIGVLISGDYWNIGSFLKATTIGAVSGAITFGIGTVFSTAFETIKGTALGPVLARIGLSTVQAGVHGFVQGTLSLMQGGNNFEQSFVAGALGSLASSAYIDFVGSTGVGNILFSALSGGVGSSLTGGNFWEGAVIGGIVAGLNHAMHATQTKSTANIYIETDGVGHVFIEIDGVVYSYGRYDGSYSPASGSLAPLGDGVLLKLEGKNASNFIAERNAKYPTDKYSVKVDGAKVKAYYNERYNKGTPLAGKDGYYKYGRAIDKYNLMGPGGNNCTTITYKALNSGGANIKPAQTPAGLRYDLQQLEYYKQGYNPSQHLWGPK
ncbi:RHS repeat-associated core domain-containing protein [Chryseobacterium sp. SIMBA_029]|uniref:RHS repeat-associated core domain-containing protein n=1 Tax=Chryseobacterium sp. SIMBA_029 TaxID=3085772 RepID=UPI00397BA170